MDCYIVVSCVFVYLWGVNQAVTSVDTLEKFESSMTLLVRPVICMYENTKLVLKSYTPDYFVKKTPKSNV